MKTGATIQSPMTIVRNPGRDVYVSATGSDLNHGRNWANSKATLQAAINLADSGDSIYVSPGDYNESVTIAAAKDTLNIIGMGGLGSVSIAPSASNATGLTCHGRDIRLANIGCAGTGTGKGAVVTGRRFSALSCKFEVAYDTTANTGTGQALVIGPGTVAQIAAASADKGDFGYFEACEFANANVGILLQASDQGASGQHKFVRCETYNIQAAHVSESTGTGGSAAVTYRDIRFLDCNIRPAEDGTEPTKYFSLNANNGNTGVVEGCYFITALNGGKNLVSTAMKWVGNRHPAGLSTAQPS